jgi:RNA polymerase sigma factor (sigma-70 family)
MDYTELAEAIEQNDRRKTNRLLGAMVPCLIAYLRIHLNATRQDAEDCAQHAVLVSLEAVQDGAIQHTERLFSFMLTTCKNKYLNLVDRQKRYTFDDFSIRHCSQPRQLISLLDKERQKLLDQCLSQLSEGYKTFIDYWFNHPASDAKTVADHFGISEANAWTRKHRVITKLSECYQRKSKI